MKSSNRKGNWNEIAGTLKHRHAKPVDKDVKINRAEEPLEPLQQKPGETKPELRKAVAKK